MADTNVDNSASGGDEPTRRDFLYIGTAAWGATGVAVGIAWPMIDQMNPSADVRALASVEIDISAVEPGQQLKVLWRGKPVFVRRRTEAEIEAARNVDVADLPHPEADEERVQKDEWLVLVGVCTHLGCVPIDSAGDYDGWYCPCHGSHYDTSGRIRRGPAPTNLEVPQYVFLNDSTIQVG